MQSCSALHCFALLRDFQDHKVKIKRETAVLRTSSCPSQMLAPPSYRDGCNYYSERVSCSPATACVGSVCSLTSQERRFVSIKNIKLIIAVQHIMFMSVRQNCYSYTVSDCWLSQHSAYGTAYPSNSVIPTG